MDALFIALVCILCGITAIWVWDTRGRIQSLELDCERLETERDMYMIDLEYVQGGIDDRQRVMDLIGAPLAPLSIGYTQRVHKRLRSMQVGSPYKIELVHAIYTEHTSRLEVALHQRFADKWSSGEWFALTPEDIDTIRAIPGPVTLADLDQMEYGNV